ncbi:hypothetical protein HispidOSU_003830 [Sigmodon hispidus]
MNRHGLQMKGNSSLETNGRMNTCKPRSAEKRETWRPSWLPTSAYGTLAFSSQIPRPGRETWWVGAAGTSLSSTRPARRPPHAVRGGGSLTGAQQAKSLLLQVQPGTFQFARDREAPPSGHDVTASCAAASTYSSL